MNSPHPFKRRMIAAAAALAALGAAAVIAMPWMETLYDPAVREKFIVFVESLGIWGYVLMFGIQLLQVVVAVIPGEPVEIIAGALYGGPGGLVLCLAGCVTGSAMIFIFMRTLGRPLAERLFRNKKLSEYSFLKDSKKLDSVTLILFLIPGTPKDMLTYLAATTPIPMLRFIVISAFARIPSIVTSTYLGDTMLEGNWYASVLLLVATLLLGLCGIFFREKALDFCRRHSPRRRTH